jgi:hypothetical protein
MRGYRLYLAIAAMLFSACGATCAKHRTIKEFQPEVVWKEVPTIEQVMEQVNGSRRIQQLQSSTITLKLDAPGTPALNANLSIERPRRLRLQARVSRLMGNELDMGSNEQVFWLQTMRPQPTLFYAQHQQFEQLTARKVLPVSPDWIIEALGLPEMNPADVHEGPIQRADGLLEVRSQIGTVLGNTRRIMVLDRSGLVREIVLYDAQGNLVAQAKQSEHENYPGVSYALPHHVQIRLLPAGEPEINFDIDVGFYLVNELMGNDPQRWTMPDPAGLSVIDLVQFGQGQQVAPIPPNYHPEWLEREAMAVPYRGFERR